MGITANHKLEIRLLRAQVALENALSDQGILAALTEYGFDRTRILKGKALFENAISLHQRYRKSQYLNIDTNSELYQFWEQADKIYMNAVKIAKIALRNMCSKLKALGLNNRRKKSLSGWLEQAQQFYSNALSDIYIISALASFGFDQDRLKSGQNMVNQVIEAKTANENDSIASTIRVLDAVVDEFDQWIADFKVIAMIALQEKSDWIRKLGLEEIR